MMLFSFKKTTDFKILNMKQQALIVLLICVFLSGISQDIKYKSEISAYVEYIQNNNQKPINYILSKYKKHDVVVFGERDHRDITQYYFLKELIHTPEFYQSVGVIYTEIGSSNYNDALNKVLQDYSLEKSSLKTKLLEIYREISYQAIWDKYNFFYLWETIHDFNKNHREYPLRIEMTSPSFDWNNISDTTDCKRETDRVERDYNKDMASCFIKSFRALQKTTRNKALVIMNYPHSMHHWVSPKGKRYEVEFSSFVKKELNDNICFIAINTQRINLLPVSDGKWDAAFKYLGHPKVGFDIKDSPFGKDTFDIWPLNATGLLVHENLFDGFIYTHPLEEIKNIIGIPGFLNKKFGDEFLRRMTLRRYYNTGEIQETKYRWEKDYCNKKREITRKADLEHRYGKGYIKQFYSTIDQWLITE